MFDLSKINWSHGVVDQDDIVGSLVRLYGPERDILDKMYQKYNLYDDDKGLIQLIKDHIKIDSIKQVEEFCGYPEFEIGIDGEKYLISFDEDLVGLIRKGK